ncbi:hypothetical protein SDC9_188939 [bioreactor metagenome]|uniref:Uncharacterized protein n=1 Tax=bioreactor metagenome TaxID=1076179 RepID=A0A645I1K7_9ZZZZ
MVLRRSQDETEDGRKAGGEGSPGEHEEHNRKDTGRTEIREECDNGKGSDGGTGREADNRRILRRRPQRREDRRVRGQRSGEEHLGESAIGEDTFGGRAVGGPGGQDRLLRPESQRSNTFLHGGGTAYACYRQREARRGQTTAGPYASYK